MNGVEADMLIDSGATTSMISTELYSKTSVQDIPSLEPFPGQLVAVNSMPLEVKSSGEFDMNIEGLDLFPSITAKSR